MDTSNTVLRTAGATTSAVAGKDVGLTVPSGDELGQLKERHYNAKVSDVRTVHNDLRIIRVTPDNGPFAFSPGQYTVLGRGYWEPRTVTDVVVVVS